MAQERQLWTHGRPGWLVLVLLVWFAVSCGPAAGPGLVNVSIRWPGHPAGLAVRLIPETAVRVRLSVTGPGIANAIQALVDRPPGQETTTTLLRVPAGDDRTLLAEALDNQDRVAATNSVIHLHVVSGPNQPVTLELLPTGQFFPQPVSPTATPSPTPTASASPTPSPTASPTPSPSPSPAGPAVVTTLVGSSSGFADGTGTSAQFNGPKGIGLDTSGNIYVGDFNNNRIRLIDAALVVKTLAGSSSSGSADGTGSAARFSLPAGLAVNKSGEIFVADFGGHAIRLVTQAAVVTTLAGSFQFGTADGTGRAAQFNAPLGLAIDNNGDIVVADTFNNLIRKVTRTGLVSTIAGTAASTSLFADGTGTNARFNDPTGITVDNSGTVYIADESNHRIRKMTQAGLVTTLAGNGTAGFADGSGTGALFQEPSAVVIGSGGNIFVADSGNHRIRMVTTVGVVSTVAGSTPGFADGTGTAALFNQPRGIGVDINGNLYVADSNNHRIRKIRF